MPSVHSILDIGSLTLSAYKFQATVSAENIANVNKAGYIPKTISQEAFKNMLSEAVSDHKVLADKSGMENNFEELVFNHPNKEIRLDDEVLLLSRAKGKYEAVAQMLNSKISMFDIALGKK